MAESNRINVFISYSHKDEELINHFLQHLQPLIDHGFINIWYDRQVTPGQDLHYEIENHLQLGDVICLMVSQNFISSKECKKEQEEANELKLAKGIKVIPVILSACGWKEYEDLKQPLVLPTDGKPINEFQNPDIGWQNVYSGLKPAIECQIKLNSLKISENFEKYLNSTELLTETHFKKTKINLNDIFVNPELDKFNITIEYEKTINSIDVITDLYNFKKILIAGEDQSGKTALCKWYFIELFKKKFYPIYLNDKKVKFSGSFAKTIKEAFNEQYIGCELEEIDQGRIVPLIDDFHIVQKAEKLIDDLSTFNYQILFVDDLFSLNIVNEKIVKSYIHFRIKTLSPSIRNELIVKWYSLVEYGNGSNEDLAKIDNATNHINTTLCNGIMPSYPFFIITILTYYDTLNKPLDQDITDQGYCYQLLIYLFLRKNGVRNDEFESYMNFLTELAYYLYKNKQKSITSIEYYEFIGKYKNNFYLLVEDKILIKNLYLTKILHIDSFSYVSFSYKYLFYFFIAKYFSDHFNEKESEIIDLITNLHKNENAYITIFISHHSKNIRLLEFLLSNSHDFYKEFTSATLSKNEVKFFDDNLKEVLNAVLPPSTNSIQQNRKEALLEEDKIEENKNLINIDEKGNDDQEEEEQEFAREFRKSIKTAEVIGRIISNRAGSLEKDKLEEFLEEGLNIFLRFLSFFFTTIKEEIYTKSMIEIIKEGLKSYKEKDNNELSHIQIEKYANKIYWNLNFFLVFGIISKIISTLGSNKLIKLFEKISKKINSPALFIIYEGILMWYCKTLEIYEIAEWFNKKEISEMARRIMIFFIVNHCSMHHISYQDQQRLESLLHIPRAKLLTINLKK